MPPSGAQKSKHKHSSKHKHGTGFMISINITYHLLLPPVCPCLCSAPLLIDAGQPGFAAIAMQQQASW